MAAGRGGGGAMSLEEAARLTGSKRYNSVMAQVRLPGRAAAPRAPAETDFPQIARVQHFDRPCLAPAACRKGNRCCRLCQ